MYSVLETPGSASKALADRYATLRKHRGWSQAEAARRSGVSLGSLKRFEQQGKISLNNLLKLANLHDRLSDFTEVFAFDEDLAAAQKRLDKIRKNG